MDQNHLNNFERGPTRIISVKFGQIPTSGLGGDLFEDCGRTDGHTDDDDDRRRVITIAHLEPSAQVS